MGKENMSCAARDLEHFFSFLRIRGFFRVIVRARVDKSWRCL